MKNMKIKDNQIINTSHNNMNFENNVISFKYLSFILFMLAFSTISNMHKESFNIFKSYEIIIKLEGTGYQNILSDYYYNCPNKIYLNEQLINTYTDYTDNCQIINISPQESNEAIINSVKLIWDNSLTDMEYMFYECSSLLTIDLSNFDAANVNNMGNMFYGCSSLISIDLSNFNTSNVNNMESMFYGCSSLISLNLSNFDTSNVNIMESMFKGCFLLISLDLSNFDTSNVSNMGQMFNGCTSLTSIDLSNFDTSNVDYMAFMFYNCSSLISIDLSNFDTSKVTKMMEMFYGCENLKKINEKNCPNIYCDNDWKYHQKKLIVENNTCVDYVDYYSEYNYENDTEYNYVDYYSEYNYENDTEYNFNLTSEEQNEKIYKEIINSILLNFSKSKDEELIIDGKSGFNFYMSYIGDDLDFLDKKFNKSNKFSNIYIGPKCENKLKEYYKNINNARIISIVYEKLSNHSTERNIQYEIYESINLTKLNLSLCKDLLIDIYVPLRLSQELHNLYEELKELGYELFDINDKFYQDICTPYKSSNGTDVILADRINYYYHNNETKCQSNCEYSYYDIETEYLKCKCDISNSEINFDNSEKFNPKILYKSFYDVLKFSNYKVLKCYKLVFLIDSLTNNIGSIIVIIFFCIYLIFFILYLIKGNSTLSNNFNKIQSQQNYKNESISENDNKKRKSNIDSKSKICQQENRFSFYIKD